ncbi:MAG: hypothetical protein KDD28_23150, partial [Phaeodactylibacter sp.]|nr:hypothetical protein [Phaeodactylibacter sp.]
MKREIHLMQNFVGFSCWNPFSFPSGGEGWLTKFGARRHTIMMLNSHVYCLLAWILRSSPQRRSMNSMI